MGFLKKFQDTEKEATVKAFEADGLQIVPMEHKSEMQLLREENEWLKMVLKDCEKRLSPKNSRTSSRSARRGLTRLAMTR